MKEYLRPWKLSTFVIGMAWLIWGAQQEIAPDWDIGISLIMGTLTYFTAPWSARVIVTLNWRKLWLAALFYYVTVDGCYWLYWSIVDPAALMMRAMNFYVSTCLFWLCGFIWLHNGPLKTLLGNSLREQG